jgi:hypothetical protein
MWHFGFGFSLNQGDNRHLVDLGIDTQTTSYSHRFSPNGRLFLWGDTSGGLFLADHEEVQRRLAEHGLGW